MYNIEPAPKQQKIMHPTTKVIVEIMDRHKDMRPIRCLLDTGTSATIILREYVAPGKAKGFKNPEQTRWATMGGVFMTKRKALLEFKLPEFSTNKTVEWVCHIDDTTPPDKAQYDIIIGTDLMNALGLDIQFSTKNISWEESVVPIKHKEPSTMEPLHSICTMWPLMSLCCNMRKRDKRGFLMLITQQLTLMRTFCRCLT